MTRAVWLLDIDGVINAASRRPPTHAWPEADWIDTKASDAKRQWRILAPRPVLDYIRAVHEGQLADIRWHTTWQHHAQQVAAALDLPTFPVQEAPEYIEAPHIAGWWKLPAALRLLEAGHRLLWTDDDAIDLHRTERSELAAAGSILIASPDPQTGLCRRHLRDIDTFLTAAADAP
jgi:hypothetical protein